VRKATDLSRSQINYRLAPSQGGYLGEEGRGLVKIHQAQIDEDTGAFGPKSMELTREGLGALMEYTARFEFSNDGEHTGNHSTADGIDTAGEREVIRQLHAKINSLERMLEDDGGYVDGDLQSDIERVESKVDELSADLAQLNQAKWGAVDSAKAENLERVLSRAPAMLYAFTILLEIDIDEIVDMGGYDDDEIAEVRRNLSTLLPSESNGSQQDEGAVSEETVEQRSQHVDDTGESESGNSGSPEYEATPDSKSESDVETEQSTKTEISMPNPEDFEVVD